VEGDDVDLVLVALGDRLAGDAVDVGEAGDRGLPAREVGHGRADGPGRGRDVVDVRHDRECNARGGRL
jgi:hypothetical protein